MYNILVAGLVISLDLCYESDFVNSYKYKTDLDADYYISSRLVDDIKEPFGQLIYETKYYKKYDMNGHIIQLQYLDGRLIGSIDYYKNSIMINIVYHNSVSEYVMSQYGLSYILSKNDAIIMHGSSIVYNNLGIMFTAKSGTGKSTHRGLWERFSDAVVLNDDKNILRLEGNDVILYSSPWSGKHKLDNNISHRLDAIVFLYQDKTNSIRRLKAMEGFKLMLSQIDFPNDDSKLLWDRITDRLLALPMYYLGCNMEKEAFDVCREMITNDLTD